MVGRSSGGVTMSIVLALLLAMLPACPTEDSTNCGWNASTHGNGTGSSFITIGTATIYL